ncbi:MAG: hypothetical protein GY707_05525 [Desulfobacteraceae bacterium]|nr:hypothetical protein [Desulfobacteraceae bacterium]
MLDIECPYCNTMMTIAFDENPPAPTSTETNLSYMDAVDLICKKAWESVDE